MPTRIFHWLLVSLFIFLVVSAEIGGQLMRWHILSGCLLSGLILFRIIWGFCGSHHARFANFVRSPEVTLIYLRDLIRGNADSYAGHNPAGAIMVLLLLIALLIQALSGLVNSDDILWSGQFYRWVPDSIADFGGMIHYLLESGLKLLVITHILAVLVHQFYFKEPLIGAMFHGHKPLPAKHTIEISTRPKVLVAGLIITFIWVGWLWLLPL